MALLGMASMDCRKILVLVLLALAAITQVQGTPESHADDDEDDPAPSVHDCRFHVEAALREYWTRKGSEPPQSKPSDQPQNITDEPLIDRTVEQAAASVHRTEAEDEEEDDDDDEVDQHDQDHHTEPSHGTAEDDDDDDVDEDDKEEQEDQIQTTEEDDDQEGEETETSAYLDQDDNDQEEEEERETSAHLDQDDDEDDDEEADEDDEDDDEADEDDEVEGAKAEAATAAADEHDDDDETADDGHDDEDDEEDEDEDQGVDDHDEDDDAKHEEEHAAVEQDDDEHDDDNDDEEEEGADEADDGDEHEVDAKSESEELGDEASIAQETDDDDEDEDDKSDDDDDDERSPDEHAGEESDESLEETPEESDISGAGVAQELPSDQPEAEQPETQADEGKDETEDEEDEDEGEADKPEEEEVEVVEEEETEEEKAARKRKGIRLRSRRHIDDILGIHEMGSDLDAEEQSLINSILRELKRLYETAIKPLESTYKYRDISTRLLGEAEVFAKPMVLFLGPWSSGKSTIINFLLGTEFTHAARKTGPELTDTDFTIVAHGDKYQTVSGTELAADWAFSGIQKFGQDFLDHVHGLHVPRKLLQRVTLVDTPGIIENRKQTERGYPFNDAFQWFIDRADAIYVVFDPSKLEIGPELEAILDQLKGRESQVRFILNKADSIQQNEIMKVVGQLMWNLSPLMGSADAPVIYTVSLSSLPFQPRAPLEFLLDQEMSFLEDLRETVDKRVENRISYARRHAVRVRNHAKMVDCYLSTFYKHKSIFSNKKKVAQEITENPNQYSIYQGLSTLSNVSRYDLPDPDVYREFFQLNPLYEFKPISSTCSYFRGCPLDKLDIAIAYDLPELLGKYKKHTKASYYVQEREMEEADSR